MNRITTNETINLSPNPSSKSEANQFESVDPETDALDKQHELNLLKQGQGPIGSLIGSADSSVNVAFVILLFGMVALIGVSIGTYFDPSSFSGYFDKVVTLEMTVAGYVFGKKSG